MWRLGSLAVGLIMLAGLGYFTRNYYWPYFQEQFRASQEQSRKDIEKMIQAQPKWKDMKFDSSKLIMPPPVAIPKIPKSPPRPARPRDNPIR